MVYSLTMSPFSLYLHIPFCKHRCGYCDFNTYAGQEDLIAGYCRALQSEIAMLAQAAGRRLPVHTIFFGGGTPSLLPAALLDEIFNAVHQAFEVSAHAEITLEANPGTVSRAYFQDLRRMGVNRLSMGVQSANAGELRLLERQHGYGDALHAYKWARQAGFDNISVDLIFGLPYQSLAAWQHNLDLALRLHPEHISLYALTVEHGTPLHKWVNRGLLPMPDPDLAADMYEFTMQQLGASGYQHYEISNWARRRGDGALLSSSHNLQYWRNQPYIGVGAGAHGLLEGMRIANVLAPAAYIQRCREAPPRPFPKTAATVNAKTLSKHTQMQETMLMGLRLIEEGVSRAQFESRYGEDMQQVFAGEIEPLRARGLLEWAGPQDDILRLTPGARILGNQVFMHFV
ncbi:MAG: radical SAM family heme chaperone HemW [Anaerolineae bacterium]|nr:radical SAM family heme chaperone HemW [Anaerolineae bacterium]